MKNKITFGLMLTAILFNTSCQKEETLKAVDEGLIGNWRWVSKDGGMSGSVQTPESTGETMKLKLNADSTYVYYKNNEIYSSGTFTITTEKYIGDHSIKQKIDFSYVRDRDLVIVSLAGDDLRLSENTTDCYNYSYKRD